MKVVSLTAARNEARHLPAMLSTLQNQTMPLERMVLVNDGSTDETANIARNAGCTVLDRPYHQEDYSGRPELAKTLNVGLEEINRIVIPFDYIMIIGADHIVPPTYLEEIIRRMEADQRIVVASGAIEGEPYEETTPRGSGRVVRKSFWSGLNELRFPVAWGWESWVYLKALEMGYETRCFRDVTSQVQRPTRIKAGGWGKAMYALGYDWKYALGRCVLTFRRNPRAGWVMFWNWVFHTNVKRLDVADWVAGWQRKRFWRRVKQIVGL